jgi:hypothetical protein
MSAAWPERLYAPGPKRILSIDGGGVRGAIAIAFLQRIETVLRERYGRPDMVLADYFDLIGGTSVGSIIAAGLALGRSADDVAATFDEMGPRMFRGGGFRVPLIQARFDPRRMEGLLQETFGDLTLGSAPWRCGFGAVSKRVDTGSSWLITNCTRAKYWDGSPDEAHLPPAERKTVPNARYPLAKVIQSSAAAPIYFDLVRLEIAAGDHGVFFDGAMTPHNNPALQLAMAALVPPYGFGWRAGADELLIVSVGAGGPRPRKPEWVSGRVPSLLKALHALISMSYDTSELGLAMLQWLGHSPNPWIINSEVGALADMRPGGAAPLWTVLRYDALLDPKWLDRELGLTFDGQAMAKLLRMDDDRQIPHLHEIGSAAAARQVDPDHFTPAFAPVAGP